MLLICLFAETSYLNKLMCKFESPQSEECKLMILGKLAANLEFWNV